MVSELSNHPSGIDNSSWELRDLLPPIHSLVGYSGQEEIRLLYNELSKQVCSSAQLKALCIQFTHRKLLQTSCVANESKTK